MGKTRTVFVGEEIKEKTTKKREKKRSLREERGIRVPGLKGGERVVAVTAGPVITEVTEIEQKAQKKIKVKRHGKRYLDQLTKIEPNKYYPLPEAVELAKKSSYSRFDGKLELHLNLAKRGKFEANQIVLQTEKDAPLIHTVLGKASDKTQDLVENMERILGVIGRQNIKKAVLKATMGPGIKVTLN